MHFRMLTLTKEEKTVMGVKIHSLNKYLGILCVPGIHLAGRSPVSSA